MAEPFVITGPGDYLMRNGKRAKVEREFLENSIRRRKYGYRWEGSFEGDNNADWTNTGGYYATGERRGETGRQDIVAKISESSIEEMELLAREEIARNETSGMPLHDQARRAFELGSQIGEAMKAAQAVNAPAPEISLKCGKIYLAKNGNQISITYRFPGTDLFLGVRLGSKHGPLLYTDTGEVFVTSTNLDTMFKGWDIVSEQVTSKEGEVKDKDQLPVIAQEIIKAQQGTRNFVDI